MSLTLQDGHIGEKIVDIIHCFCINPIRVKVLLRLDMVPSNGFVLFSNPSQWNMQLEKVFELEDLSRNAGSSDRCV